MHEIDNKIDYLEIIDYELKRLQSNIKYLPYTFIPNNFDILFNIIRECNEIELYCRALRDKLENG